MRSLRMRVAGFAVIIVLALAASVGAYLLLRPQPALPAETILAQTTPPARDLADLARRMGRIQPGADLTPPAQAPARAVGDRAEFWVNDSHTNTYRRASATLKVVTPHLYMWVEEALSASQDQLEASAAFFESTIYPTLHRVFGQEWTPGIDGDPRLHVFNGSVPSVSGYFYSPDEYPAEVNPYSNEHEIFFVNLEVITPGTEAYNALLAHEFQHMIHWRADRDEEVWVNEGLSELAMRICDLPVTSFPAYLRSPDIPLADWPDRTRSTAPHYGGSYLLMEYLLGRFGEGFLRELVSEPRNGVAGIEQVLGRRGLTFDHVFRDWTAANLLSDDRLGGGAYGYPTIHIFKPELTAEATALPAVISDTVQPFGVDYISISAGDLRLEFAGQAQVALAPFSSAPDDSFWWSNRGDNDDMTLTREVDLRRVSQATLHASLWHSIEESYDFAFAEVSTDGGTTWHALQGQHTRDVTPVGTDPLPGYTGNSGGGAQPEWISEVYSLIPFAGQKILLRFEYVTDDAVNLDGFWIRSLEIPEIGWKDDGESSKGWGAQGFVRVQNVLPQKYLLTAVLHGPTPEVVPIAVGPEGRASASLHAPEGATLIVSSITRHTRQPATYTVGLR